MTCELFNRWWFSKIFIWKIIAAKVTMLSKKTSRIYTAYSLSHCPIWITRVTKQQYHSHLTWWSISRAYITRPAHGKRLYNLTRPVFFERCLKASLRHVHRLNHTHTERIVEHSHTCRQVTSCIVNQTFIHTNASHDWRSYNQQQHCCECRHDIWKIKFNHFFGKCLMQFINMGYRVMLFYLTWFTFYSQTIFHYMYSFLRFSYIFRYVQRVKRVRFL